MTDGHDVEEFIRNAIHAAEVYKRVEENMLRDENEEMQGVRKRLLSDRALIKGKLKTGTTNEIVIVEEAEAKRVSEAEESKQRSEDGAEADRRTKTQIGEEETQKKAECKAAKEVVKQNIPTRYTR